MIQNNVILCTYKIAKTLIKKYSPTARKSIWPHILPHNKLTNIPQWYTENCFCAVFVWEYYTERQLGHQLVQFTHLTDEQEQGNSACLQEKSPSMHMHSQIHTWTWSTQKSVIRLHLLFQHSYLTEWWIMDKCSTSQNNCYSRWEIRLSNTQLLIPVEKEIRTWCSQPLCIHTLTWSS